MGYIGIPSNLEEVGKFIEKNELAASHVQTAYCFFAPLDKRPYFSLKQFKFIFFCSNHWYYTSPEGQTIKTDCVQFLKYLNKGEAIDGELLNGRGGYGDYSLYCNQGAVLTWARKCVNNHNIYEGHPNTDVFKNEIRF